jgi:hypothetical protein
MAENLEHPPHTGCRIQSKAIVADHFLAIANAHFTDMARKFFRPRQHVGQGAFSVRNQIDIEELRRWNPGFQEFCFCIALCGWQMP